MPIKIAIIGAGSLGFTRKLVADLLPVPEFSDVEIALTDIDARNLEMVTELCRRDIASNKLKARLTSTISRRTALRGANYVFCVVRIGGLDAYATDIEIHSYIIEAMETGRPYRGHFNLPNNHTIPNLPSDAIVEAPGYVDRHGFNCPQLAELPPGCAAVCSVSVGVQRLGVLAAVSGDDSLLRQAFLLDPLVGAVCNPPEIWQLVDEMLVAGEKWLPQYKRAITAANKRLKAGPRIQTRPAPGIRARPPRKPAKSNPRAGH
jgi:alpha-galactosidase/6-phospho-beta-glucosidase family protein